MNECRTNCAALQCNLRGHNGYASMTIGSPSNDAVAIAGSCKMNNECCNRMMGRWRHSRKITHSTVLWPIYQLRCGVFLCN